MHIEEVDKSLVETVEAVDTSFGSATRANFLRRSALAGGAVVGSGALLGAVGVPGALAKSYSTGDRPPAKFGTGDIGILNYALTLEYLESAFYDEALEVQRRRPFLKTAQQRTFLETVQHDEMEHVATLKQVLGRQAINRPTFDFHGDTTKEDTFLKAAFTFENTGVSAYSGQAFNIKSPEYLAAALSIVTIEARHASVVGLLRFGTEYGITPNGAFDKPLGATAVLKGVTSLNYIQ
jgi:rubrerythrin